MQPEVAVEQAKHSRLLIPILALAAGFRLFNVAKHGLWWDERISVSNAAGSILAEPIASSSSAFTGQDFWSGNTIHNVIEATVTQDGGNNLLFNVLLHYWIQLWGTQDLSVRLLSALFGILSVWLVYRLALSLCSKKIACIAGVLAAAHPFLIRYSQETRSYALATFLSLSATLVFIHLVGVNHSKSPLARNWLLYGLLIGAALLSHYLTIYVFLGHALFAILHVRGQRVWLDLVRTAAIGVILVSAWMLAGGNRGLKVIASMNQSYQQRATHPSVDENWALPAMPSNLLKGWLQTSLAISGNLLQMAGLRLGQLGILLIIPVTLLAGCWRARKNQELSSFGLLLLVILSGSGLVFSTILALHSGHIISFQPLYGLFATPYLTILLAVGMAQVAAFRGWPKFTMGCLVCLYSVTTLVSIKLVYDDAPQHRPPNIYRVLSEQIIQASLPGDVIVYRSWADARLHNLYLRNSNSIIQTVEPDHKGNSIKVVRNGFTRLEINRGE